MARRVDYATNGDVHIAYDVLGEGPPDIVFVPPWFSNLDLLDDLPAVERAFERLASFARVIRYDRRGSGLSDRAPGHATLEEGIDDLFAVLDAAGSERTALIGVNESGSLCALTAATHPDRVSALILYGSYAATLWQPDYPWAPRPEEREQEVAFLIETWGDEAIAGGINASVEPDPEFVRWAARWMRNSVTKDALPRAYELLSKTDVRAVLPTIDVATLVLHRVEDPVVPIDNGRYIADRVPNAKLVELPGDNHIPFLGDWEPIADEIEEFLTGTRREPSYERVLSTILFADIVESTKKATQMGDRRWSDLLDRYEILVNQEVARSQGRLVKMLGDGALATFDGPARAIQSACRLTEVAKQLSIEIRCGIHTGEVERRGDDLAGIAVHIADRVASYARSSEVLVSGAVPPLVAGAGLDFEDRGVHELRGVDGDWRILKVIT